MVGAPHGHIYEPILPGCVGGTATGTPTVAGSAGYGGGVLNINVHDSIRIDGLIHANAQPGEMRSGGGSGGSIMINTRHIWGYGYVQVHGGSAEQLAGGGAGREWLYNV